jgi:hypothetical protein
MKELARQLGADSMGTDPVDGTLVVSASAAPGLTAAMESALASKQDAIDALLTRVYALEPPTLLYGDSNGNLDMSSVDKTLLIIR